MFRAQQARTSGAALANLKEAAVAEEEYPHVYQATKMSGLKGLSYGGRLALPMGTTREEWPVRHLLESAVGGAKLRADLCRSLHSFSGP